MSMKVYGISVSVGNKALPPIKEALEHAKANPDHDPYIICKVDDYNPPQSAEWRCRDCEEHGYGVRANEG